MIVVPTAAFVTCAEDAQVRVRLSTLAEPSATPTRITAFGDRRHSSSVVAES